MKRLRLTTLISVGLLAFLIGLVVARSHINLHWYWAVLSLPLLIVLLKKRKIEAIFCVVIVGVLIGWWRGSVYMQKLGVYNTLRDKKVVLEVTADDDAVYGDKTQLTFVGSHIHMVEPKTQNMIGKVKVAGFGEAAIYRGDRIQVSGKLFITRGSQQASIGYGELHATSRYTSIIETIRHNFNAGIFSALPEPQASFGLGLLIGQRNTLPQLISTQLAVVGLTHLIAVSGYNLTILMDAARRLFGKRSKYQSFIFSIALIGVFLLFTGNSPSIIRAAIVSVLSLSAWYYGRKVKPLLLILLAACITTYINPLYLWTDIGWYLSFLAFFGILILAPLILKRLYNRKKPSGLVVLVVESLCAQVMTIPLIMYIFHQVSLVSLLANVLVVPLVPIAMLLTLIAGVVGAIIPAVAGWLTWPAQLLLTYMLDIVNIFSKVPHALQQEAVTVAGLVVLYGVAVSLCLVLWRKTKNKIADIPEIL